MQRNTQHLPRGQKAAGSNMNNNVRKKILLVEDEVIIAMAQSEVLKARGYDISTVCGGQDAFELIEADPSIDLVLMDIDLGKGLNGTETARQILALRNLPIVFLTSHAEREMVEMVRGITRYGYIIKSSGDFVLLSSLEMAFELFEAHETLEKKNAELRETNRVLAEKEEDYHLLFESSPSGVFIAQEGRLKIFNKAWVDIAGHPADELATKPFTSFIHPDDSAMVLDRHARRLKGETVETNYPFRIITAAGIVKWINITSTLFTWKGKPSTLNYIIDITEQKRAEEALQNLSQFNQEVVSGSAEGIVVYDRELRYLVWNQFMETLTGVQASDLLGTCAIDVFPHLREHDVDRLLERALEGETVRSQDTPFHSPITGRSGWVVGSYAPHRDGNHDIIGVIATIQDISERKLAEEKIKSLLREKELLLREMHHRIKNNMNTMISLLTLQSKTMKDPSASAALLDARSRLQSMGVLYQKLYQAGGLEEISIGDYLPSLIDEIVGIFPNRDMVIIETGIENFMLDERKVNPLGMMVNELLTNAMKYAFAGRDEGLIRISASIKGTHATLIIEDNGVGVPDSIDIAASTGFGLQLISMLTEQLEGTIRLERQNGSRFILEFDV
jgi:two-component system, sensor histidine kinase PdtaS